MSRSNSMQAIADIVGCSRMAVSLALRGSPEIGEKTRERILQVAKELGYRPNPLVSTLMAQRAGNRDKDKHIPMAIINTFADFNQFKRVEFFDQVLQGVQRRAQHLGFYGEIFHLKSKGGLSPAQLDRIMITRGIHGAVILPMADPEQIFDISWERFSVATIAHTWHGVPVHRAAPDVFGNVIHLMEKLVHYGYTRPGLIECVTVHERTRGIAAGAYFLFQDEHPELPKIPRLLCDRQDPDLKSKVTLWLNKHKPDVIIGHSNLDRVLERLDPELPKRIPYVELNLLPSQYHRVSGIATNPAVIGEQAVDIVVSRIHRNEFGLPHYPRMTMVAGVWHETEDFPKKEVVQR